MTAALFLGISMQCTSTSNRTRIRTMNLCNLPSVPKLRRFGRFTGPPKRSGRCSFDVCGGLKGGQPAAIPPYAPIGISRFRNPTTAAGACMAPEQ